ncbi:hypothetical protein BMT54_04795 [Pasteurellaceae bacterium 15-036681]|nr:hypothetical protein BMT54_04795 [Pasteurellaceae bacterium 15-036681]
MLKDKPIVSNQYGALVMAFVPFIYAIFKAHFILPLFWLGLAWLFLYLFSYPFFAIFSKKHTQPYKKWAGIYIGISTLFAIPVVMYDWTILQFILPILPLAAVQIYFAKKRDERNLINDIAGIATFGIIGMAAFYLVTQQYNWEIFIHPTLFFIAGTFYVKSVARERKNPIYKKWSLGLHLGFFLCYLGLGMVSIALSYALASLRAVIVPYQRLSIKQVGMLEFIVVAGLMVGLYFS